MKFIKFIILPSLIILAGCSKFLDRQPNSFNTESNYYQNTQQVETGVIGCYASLRDVYNLDYILAGLRSDDAYISESDGDINTIDYFTEPTTNSYVENYWKAAYNSIKQCNVVLQYLGNVTDSVKKVQFEGEVRFIRAHMYFNLVRLYGAVPLVLNEVSYNDTLSAIKRIAPSIVYRQIVADFDSAIIKLPLVSPSSQVGRVNIYAAKGMLAKVYLTMGNMLNQPYPNPYYDSSKALLLSLLNNPGPYQLLPNYTSVFGVDNEMNPEIMYAVRYQSNANGIGNTFTFDMQHLAGSHGFKAASDFRGNTPFPATDVNRFNQTFIPVSITSSTSGITGISYFTGGKYLDPNSAQNDGGSDFIVLRYADVIMMYAEVENEINGNTPLTAADSTNFTSRLYQLNRIRKRASGSNPAAVPAYLYNSSTVKTQAAFRTTIQKERRREFCEEDQRWYDLIRWGEPYFMTSINAHLVATKAANLLTDDHQMIYEIPQREIDIASGYGITMPQNPGY